MKRPLYVFFFFSYTVVPVSSYTQYSFTFFSLCESTSSRYRTTNDLQHLPERMTFARHCHSFHAYTNFQIRLTNSSFAAGIQTQILFSTFFVRRLLFALIILFLYAPFLQAETPHINIAVATRLYHHLLSISPFVWYENKISKWNVFFSALIYEISTNCVLIFVYR